MHTDGIWYTIWCIISQLDHCQILILHGFQISIDANSEINNTHNSREKIIWADLSNEYCNMYTLKGSDLLSGANLDHSLLLELISWWPTVIAADH